MKLTSKRAYKRIVEENLLSPLQLKLYTLMFKNGSFTVAEMEHVTRYKCRETINKLLNLGLVEVVGVRRCMVFKRDKEIWNVIRGALPKGYKHEDDK